MSRMDVIYVSVENVKKGVPREENPWLPIQYYTRKKNIIPLLVDF